MWPMITGGRTRRIVSALAAAFAVALVLAPATPTVASTSSGPTGGIETAAGAASPAQGLRGAVRLGVPRASAVEGPVPVPVNRSTCRTDLPAPVMMLMIDEVSYSCPVYRGGQTTMDAGAVAVITQQGPSVLLAEHPGDAGTLWIASHRASHGGAFAAVPSLADGALVTVSDGARVATYRIVSRLLVEVRDDLVIDATGRPTSAATLDAIMRPDRGGGSSPRLLLQTCEGASLRWMIYADLVAD